MYIHDSEGSDWCVGGGETEAKVAPKKPKGATVSTKSRKKPTVIDDSIDDRQEEGAKKTPAAVKITKVRSILV